MTFSKYTANKPISHGYEDIKNNFHIIEHNIKKGYARVIEQKKITGWYIYELRKLNELSQKQVAFRVGVTQAQYSKYENGKDQLSNEMLIRFANVFATTIEYISGLKKESNNLNEERKKYLKRITLYYRYGYYPENTTEKDLDNDANIYEEALKLINKKINTAIEREAEVRTLKTKAF